MATIIYGDNIPTWSEPLPTTRRSLPDLADDLWNNRISYGDYVRYLVANYGFDYTTASETADKILEAEEPPVVALKRARQMGYGKTGGLAAVGVGVAVLVAFALIIGRRR